MAIEIRDIVETTREEWARAFAASQRATFFHGPEWSEVWEAYTQARYRPSPRRIEFSDGLTAVLGLTTEHVGFGVQRHHLSPASNYGGWVSTGPVAAEHAAALTAEILRLRSLVWRPSPYDRENGVEVPGAWTETTHVIDLREGADAAHARWKSSAKYEVRKAQREGAAVREGTTRDDWLLYTALYRLSLQRWAAPSSVYGESLFTLLHELDSPSVRLFLTEKEQMAAAGALVFVSHRYAVHWHGASMGRAVPGASNLLQWEIVDRLAAEGVETYDLNSSAGHEGVIRFKESIGASPQPAPLVVQTHRFDSVARRAQRLKQRLFRRLSF